MVEENNLARHISTLRKALQQRRGQHDFISTIPGRGYLFVPAVAQIDELHAADASEPPHTTAAPSTTPVPDPPGMPPLSATLASPAGDAPATSTSRRWNRSAMVAIAASLVLMRIWMLEGVDRWAATSA